MFEVETISSKSIEDCSFYKYEKEVLLQPFSLFTVLEVQTKPAYVKLKEIHVPRNQRVIFWVDDNPGNNTEIAEKFEKEGKSIVFCRSTDEALELIENNLWLLYF